MVAQINGTTIAATVPTGTDVTGLIATFDTTGASVKVGTVVQTSGATANDFTSPLSYVVTAADNSTKTYMITVEVARSASKEITSFVFRSVDNPTLDTVDNPGLPANATGTINGTAITLTVPVGTDVTALVARFTFVGKFIKIGPKMQSSRHTANDFTSPVTYTVYAQDNSTKAYVVTVNTM